MARSFSNVKAISGMISKAINARGISSSASASRDVVSKGGVPATMVKKIGKETAQKVSWVPDPRTGFYRPENVAEEIDVAELRNVLLKKN